MGEFDLSLIREFRNRTAFYDRNSPRFKDKVYTAHEWQEISNKLGYDVSLLKDRMLQLRNRYNLEKRRLEQLREESPLQPIISPWPLYDELAFLSEHIRARRSYKNMTPLQTIPALPELSNSESNPSSTTGAAGAYDHTPAPFAANGLVTVKMETEEDDDNEDTEAESASHSGAENAGIAAASTSCNTIVKNGTDNIKSFLPGGIPPSITIRRLDTLRAATTESLQQPRKRSAKTMHSVEAAGVCKMRSPPPAKQFRLNAREEKYVAFGNFMFSSLLELPQPKALLLVEKFTSELVKVLIQKNEAADTSENGGGGVGVDNRR